MAAGAVTAQTQDAEAVLARAKASSGGANWDSVQTLQMAGTRSAGGLSGAWQLTQALGSGRYVESSALGAFQQAHGFDGQHVWRRE